MKVHFRNTIWCTISEKKVLRGKLFFVVQVCTKNFNKVHEKPCAKISISFSLDFCNTQKTFLFKEKYVIPLFRFSWIHGKNQKYLRTNSWETLLLDNTETFWGHFESPRSFLTENGIFWISSLITLLLHVKSQEHFMSHLLGDCKLFAD